MESSKRKVDETSQTSETVVQVSKQSKPLTKEEKLIVVAKTMVVSQEGAYDVPAMVTVNDIDTTQKKRDVLIFADCSGSMKNDMDRLSDMIHHLSTHSKDQNAHLVNLSIGVYGSLPYVPGIDPPVDNGEKETLPHGYAPWNTISDTTLAGLMNFTSKYVSTRGRTNMQGMIESGLSILKGRRKKDFNDAPGHLQHLVILTDGMPDPGQTECVLTETIKNGIGDDAVVVSIMLLGNNVDLSLSSAMSSGTSGGILAYANKAEDLCTSFDEIINQIFKSSRAFNIKISDSVNHEHVLHFGVLTELNNTALVKLNFGPKIGSDSHLACTLVLSGGVSATSCVMPYYAKDQNDEAWKSDAAKMPEALQKYMDALEMEKNIERDVMQVVYYDGFDNAAQLARTLTQEASSTLTAPALQRLRGFADGLLERSKRSDASTMPAVSRMMSATASYSQSAR